MNSYANALQALGYILISSPEYMLEKDIGKILEASLASSADFRLKVHYFLLCTFFLCSFPLFEWDAFLFFTPDASIAKPV